MRTRTKYTLAGCATVAGIGVGLGYFKAAFFLPKWTLHRARSYKPGGAA